MNFCPPNRLANYQIAAWVSLLLVNIAACQRPDTASPDQDLKPEPVVTALFDGQSLGKWQVIRFSGNDNVSVANQQILVEMGYPLAGIVYADDPQDSTDDLPTSQYRLELEAKKVDGTDFFCCLTFPVKNEFCSFVVGGWGGTVTGISCIDQQDASGNQTKTLKKYDANTWYHIRVDVLDDRLACWIDDERVVDLQLDGIVLSLRTEVELCKPMGICSFSTSAAYRNIRYTLLEKSSITDKSSTSSDPAKKN